MTPRRLVLATVLAGMLATGAGAQDDWRRCPGNGWEVTGASEGDHSLVCRGVAGAAAVFAACGVRTVAATRIRVDDELPHSRGVKVWGLYDAGRSEILLSNPAVFLAEAPEGSPFTRIAPPLAFVAIAAHEAAHAMLYAGGLGEDRHLEHEYIAAVVQMSVLPDAARAALIDPLKIGATVGIWELNPMIHALQPDLFAGLAWRHFEGEPDNCAFVRAMAEGTLRLADFSAF